MQYLRHIILLSFLVLTCLDTSCAKADSMSGNLSALITGSGRVLIVRHALAPGTGDPDNFKIDDCSTQRNLDASGRKQALAMGEWLRSQGVERARVFSSQWCRCKDTAELMKLGPVTELPALNSFFQRWEEKESNMRALSAFLSEQNVDETLIVLVTHQVTITALTGVYPTSGTGVMLVLDGEGGFEIGPIVQFE
jgi:phosphohistidine phosphatase SixA